MAIAALIIKIMPESPQTDLKAIQEHAKLALEKERAQNISFQEEPIGFGLIALKVKMAWPEQQDTDIAEKALQSIPHVSSVSIEDYRRAFG